MDPESDLGRLQARVVECRRCPRLVEWRERVAREKRAAFADEEYWGRPIAGFGDPAAPVYVLGLAPAAHGGNRTGRVFTGDRSGDWLFASMHRTGFANQAESFHLLDGLRLEGLWVTAAVRYGFLGTSDANVWVCLGVTAALAVPTYLWSQWLFTTGRKLKA